MTTLLKSATIIDTSSPFHLQIKDILIVNGTITEIEDHIPEKKEYTTCKRDNLHVSIGWFDTSVSFGEPGYEERETLANGLLTASKSGFTAIAVHPNTNPVTDHKAAVEFLKHKVRDSATELYPIGALTQGSLGQEMAELYDMQQSGAIAFGDYKTPIANENLLKISLLYAQNFDGLVLSFPKNDKIAGEGVAHEGANATKLGLKGIPSLSEEIQIVRDLFLLEYTGGKLHIPTISTEKSVALIREAKKKGLQVSCSVAIHNLVLTDDELYGFNAKNKVTPPLRTKNDCKALIKGVKDGTISIITSDHAPIDIENKKVEFSKAEDGTIGLESAFGILNSILDINTIIQCLSTNPRTLFKLRQPCIAIDQKAELSLFNPEKTGIFEENNIHSTSKNSIFLHKPIKGQVYGIYNNKQLVLNS